MIYGGYTIFDPVSEGGFGNLFGKIRRKFPLCFQWQGSRSGLVRTLRKIYTGSAFATFCTSFLHEMLKPFPKITNIDKKSSELDFKLTFFGKKFFSRSNSLTWRSFYAKMFFVG